MRIGYFFFRSICFALFCVSASCSSSLFDRKSVVYYDVIEEAANETTGTLLFIVIVEDSLHSKREFVTTTDLIRFFFRSQDQYMSDQQIIEALRSLLYDQKSIKYDHQLFEQSSFGFQVEKKCTLSKNLKKNVRQFFNEKGYLKENVSEKDLGCLVSYLFKRKIFIGRDDYAGDVYIEATKRIDRILSKKK